MHSIKTAQRHSKQGHVINNLHVHVKVNGYPENFIKSVDQPNKQHATKSLGEPKSIPVECTCLHEFHMLT